MLGVVVLTQPQLLDSTYQTPEMEEAEYPYYTLGVFFALTGSVSSGFAYYTMRKMAGGLHSSITTFYFGFLSSIWSA